MPDEEIAEDVRAAAGEAQDAAYVHGRDLPLDDAVVLALNVAEPMQR
jgi:hypothetical protein